jgi:hypothetical protein
MKPAAAFLFRGELKHFKYYLFAGAMAVIQMQSENRACAISVRRGE